MINLKVIAMRVDHKKHFFIIYTGPLEVATKNVIGDVTFPICHNDNCQVFNRLKYLIIAQYPAIFRFRQQI